MSAKRESTRHGGRRDRRAVRERPRGLLYFLEGFKTPSVLFFRLRRREAELAARQCVTDGTGTSIPWKTPLLNHSRCYQVEIQRGDGSRNPLSIQIQGARFPKNQFKSGKKKACCGGLECVRGSWWATIVRGVLRLGTAGKVAASRSAGRNNNNFGPG